jgi:hypothetical protein
VRPSENVTIIVNWHVSPGRLSLAEHVMTADVGAGAAEADVPVAVGPAGPFEPGLPLSSHATPAMRAASPNAPRMMMRPALLVRMGNLRGACSLKESEAPMDAGLTAP